MSGPPIDYDPRRLFPFGLSPIPELPSELASEVSSVYSYYDDSEVGSEAEDEEEEEEEIRSRISIMYSGNRGAFINGVTKRGDILTWLNLA